jgi:hypothetical protein
MGKGGKYHAGTARNPDEDAIFEALANSSHSNHSSGDEPPAEQAKQVPKGGRPSKASQTVRKPKGKGLYKAKGSKHRTRQEMQAKQPKPTISSSPPPDGFEGSPGTAARLHAKLSFRRAADLAPIVQRSTLMRDLPPPDYKMIAPVILQASRMDVEDGNGWNLLESIAVRDIAEWFDGEVSAPTFMVMGHLNVNQMVDWGVKDYDRCLAVTEALDGPVGDHPRDPRARTITLQWHPNVPAATRKQWVKESTPVWRARYDCTGDCFVHHGKRVVGRKGAGVCHTKLRLVVTADDLERVGIWQLGDHGNRGGDGSLLQPSLKLRSIIREELQKRNLPLSALKKCKF